MRSMSIRAATHIRSNLIGYLALFVAFSGAAYAAGLPKNSVKSKQIKDGQVATVDLADGAVTGPKVDESTLAPDVLQQRVSGACPPGKAIASVGQNGSTTCNDFPAALPPTGPAGGDLAGSSYPNPQLAVGSVTAAELDAGSSFTPAPGVPDPVVPACLGSSASPFWQNLAPHVNNGAAFARDEFGFVHLRGVVQQCFGSPFAPEIDPLIFTLPAGFQPAREEVLLAISSNTAGFVRINVNADGQVSVSTPPGNEKWLSLDNISFRCDPTEGAGCSS